MSIGTWYCDYVALGPVPYALMALPLAGAFFYGRQKQRLGLMLIGAWIAIQVPISYVNYVVATCPGDPAALQEEMQEFQQNQQAEPQQRQ